MFSINEVLSSASGAVIRLACHFYTYSRFVTLLFHVQLGLKNFPWFRKPVSKIVIKINQYNFGKSSMTFV